MLLPGFAVDAKAQPPAWEYIAQLPTMGGEYTTPGMYYCRLSGPEHSETRRLMLMR